MSVSVARVIEQIVDWTHEEIIALEEHLGLHPNRKAAAVAQAEPTVVDPVQPSVVTPLQTDGTVIVSNGDSAFAQQVSAVAGDDHGA